MYRVQNVQGRVWIVVLPKDNTGHVVVIKGPQWLGAGGDRVPATVMVRDVTRDGRADLILQAGSHTFVYTQSADRQGFVLQGQSQGGRA